MNIMLHYSLSQKNDGVSLPRRINSKNRLLFLYDSIPIDYEKHCTGVLACLIRDSIAKIPC